MAEAAQRFLESLSTEQRRKAVYSFPADEERRRWYYTPSQRGGLPLAEMSSPQQRFAHQLIASGLSRPGYTAAAVIMGWENVLDELEEWRSTGYAGRPEPSRGRDPLLYFVSVFGEPGSVAWGWRAGGHHLALHYTILEGEVVSPTPCFFGLDPAERAVVGGRMLRPLAGEEDLGRALLLSLDAEQRAVAIVSAVAPPDLIQQNRPRLVPGASPKPLYELWDFEVPEAQRATHIRHTQDRERELGFEQRHLDALRYDSRPKGLSAAQMLPDQQDHLLRLLRQYLERMPVELAEREAARVAGERLRELHFVWAGGLEHGEPHYYRLEGPRLQIEYDNTPRSANHVHSVWRDPEGDFGGDVLAEHYALAHSTTEGRP
jgi:hypothetical protein